MWACSSSAETATETSQGSVVDTAGDGDVEQDFSMPAGPDDGSGLDADPLGPIDARHWERIEHEQAVFGGDPETPTGWAGQEMRAVTRGGPGLVAVGVDNRHGHAVVWTSEDGAAWQLVPHDDAVFGGDGAQAMWSVTEGGPGLVAVGYDYGRSAAAAWTSNDGIGWQRVAHDDAAFGGDVQQEMVSVTAGGPGLVAVGSDFGRGSAAVWTSVDGLTWDRVPHDAAVFGNGEWRPMHDVVAGGPGLVAVGYDDGLGAATVWTSVDGLVWDRVPHDEGVFSTQGVSMRSVTVGGPGLVAVGYDDGLGAAAVWTSIDGLVWDRVSHNEAMLGGGHAHMESVVSGGPGLVAVGSDDQLGAAAVWTSADGLSWERVLHSAAFDGEGEQGMLSVTVGGPGLVGVGYDHGLGAATVWTTAPGGDESERHSAAPAEPLGQADHAAAAISAGSEHTCGLDSTGAPVCWGADEDLFGDELGQSSPPAGLNLAAISAGSLHTCGLDGEGRPVCWGRNYDGQSSPPAGLTLTTISAGGDATCGLEADGSPVCWGTDEYRQSSPPLGLQLTAISTGLDHSCGLESDGTPVCWGDSSSDRTSPPAGVTLTTVSAGDWRHTCGLDPSGAPICWGLDDDGQASPPPGLRLTAISAGGWHTCGLDSRGAPICWGSDFQGESSPPDGLSLVAISAGAFHTCGVETDGTPVCWGWDESGQASPPSGVWLGLKGGG